jgi:hypothetical protein
MELSSAETNIAIITSLNDANIIKGAPVTIANVTFKNELSGRHC